MAVTKHLHQTFMEYLMYTLRGAFLEPMEARVAVSPGFSLALNSVHTVTLGKSLPLFYGSCFL